jgi:crotonobetainyl-CoA:carnitine CoA-transferase CaiB-like acyl-CoA transferase
MTPLPLSGIHVLHCAVIRAGPSATMRLVDCGADVIRVDRHPRFNCHARNKLSMTVKAPRQQATKEIPRAFREASQR